MSLLRHIFPSFDGPAQSSPYVHTSSPKRRTLWWLIAAFAVGLVSNLALGTLGTLRISGSGATVPYTVSGPHAITAKDNDVKPVAASAAADRPPAATERIDPAASETTGGTFASTFAAASEAAATSKAPAGPKVSTPRPLRVIPTLGTVAPVASTPNEQPISTEANGNGPRPAPSVPTPLRPSVAASNAPARGVAATNVASPRNAAAAAPSVAVLDGAPPTVAPPSAAAPNVATPPRTAAAAPTVVVPNVAIPPRSTAPAPTAAAPNAATPPRIAAAAPAAAARSSAAPNVAIPPRTAAAAPSVATPPRIAAAAPADAPPTAMARSGTAPSGVIPPRAAAAAPTAAAPTGTAAAQRDRIAAQVDEVATTVAQDPVFGQAAAPAQAAAPSSPKAGERQALAASSELRPGSKPSEQMRSARRQRANSRGNPADTADRLVPAYDYLTRDGRRVTVYRRLHGQDVRVSGDEGYSSARAYGPPPRHGFLGMFGRGDGDDDADDRW
jgi:hypothetical protein